MSLFKNGFFAVLSGFLMKPEAWILQ